MTFAPSMSFFINMNIRNSIPRLVDHLLSLLSTVQLYETSKVVIDRLSSERSLNAINWADTVLKREDTEYLHTNASWGLIWKWRLKIFWKKPHILYFKIRKEFKQKKHLFKHFACDTVHLWVIQYFLLLQKRAIDMSFWKL